MCSFCSLFPQQLQKGFFNGHVALVSQIHTFLDVTNTILSACGHVSHIILNDLIHNNVMYA